MISYRPSLTASIMAFLCFLLLLTWLLFSLLAFKTAANDLYAQKGEHARTLLAAFISQLPENLPSFPEGIIPPDSPAAVYVQKLSDDAGFTRLTLLDGNGKVIFSAGREGSDIYQPFSALPSLSDQSGLLPDGGGITHITPVIRNGVTVGKAGLLLTLSAEKERLNRTRQLLLAYFVLNFFMLLGLGSFILSRIVVNPINRLLSATARITGGQYGQALHISGSAELARLAESFNEMSATLQNKDQLVSQHVTALEKANSDLRQAREEALRTEKMASIGLLAAGMAHEIGTPLASIMGYADLVAAEQPEDRAIQDYAGRIAADCARIDRIVRGLLDYSRPHQACIETTDVRAVVRASLELLAQQGAFKGLQVKMSIVEGLPPAKADPHQLQQVLVNLLLNARDALAPGGTLKVAARPDQRRLRIDLADNGAGISPEHIRYIFDPFFTTKAPGRGTGLGLAIAARIVEGFGGRITVVSNPGSGSCFTVWLLLAEGEGT